LTGSAEPDARGARRRWSLAVRLAFWYAGSAFAVSVTVVVSCYLALAWALEREDDEFLRDRLDRLRAKIQSRPDDAEMLRLEIEGAGSRESEPLYLRAIWLEKGSIYQTPGTTARIDAQTLPRTDTPATDLPGLDGRPLRVASATFTASNGPWLLQAALDRARDDAFVASFRHVAIAIAAFALLASALAGELIARAGMRPVREIAAAAERIRSTSLGERIPLERLPAELADLATTFNAMLDRLQRSFDQISRFSADIAHELRTPLNALRTTAEVALGRSRSEDEYRDALGAALEEGARLSRIVDSLLFLARAEADRTRPEATEIDVPKELEAVREYHALEAAEAGVALAVSAPETLPARLDRTLFQRAVDNLVTNALKHTPRGGAVTMRARKENGRLLVEVEDTGPGIAAEHLPHVFDRFYRADTSRATRTGGFGLGLAIVKSIAELHKGKAEIESEVGRGTRVRMELPQEGEDRSQG
jgi:two-component system heavy metal sensor histidine kinase CusS